MTSLVLSGSRLGARRSRWRGQALVEVALILPMLLVIIIGLFDFGRAIYVYNTLSNAARTAARVAVVDQDPAAIEAAARREAVAIAPLSVVLSGCSTMDCLYTVTVSHPYQAATPLIGAIVGPITLDATASMPVEFENP